MTQPQHFLSRATLPRTGVGVMYSMYSTGPAAGQRLQPVKVIHAVCVHVHSELSQRHALCSSVSGCNESLQPGVPNQMCFMAGLPASGVNRGVAAMKESNVTLHTTLVVSWGHLVYVFPHIFWWPQKFPCTHSVKFRKWFQTHTHHALFYQCMQSPASHSTLWIAFPFRISAGNTSIRPVWRGL